MTTSQKIAADVAGKHVSWGSQDPGELFNTIRARTERGDERGVWIMPGLPHGSPGWSA